MRGSLSLVFRIANADIQGGWIANPAELHFYPILLVGMNNFCTFAKVMTVTVIANTILRYEVLR